jgi:hypothetical protein
MHVGFGLVLEAYGKRLLPTLSNPRGESLFSLRLKEGSLVPAADQFMKCIAWIQLSNERSCGGRSDACNGFKAWLFFLSHV